MLVQGVAVLILVVSVEGAVMNSSCPAITPRKLDWKALDGTWYVAAVATSDIEVKGDCAMMQFDHQNMTKVTIELIANKTVSNYIRNVTLIQDPSTNSSADLLKVFNESRSEFYSFLDVKYDHYAVMFTCYENDDGNSTYEIWKLTRTTHLTVSDADQMSQAVANYSLQNTEFYSFNNTEGSCKSSADQLGTSTTVLLSAAVMTLFRKFY